MCNLRTVEEEIYTHEYLWRSASLLLRRAEEEANPSYHFLLPALMMSFLAFEAFVNFCGFVVLPELWKDEKKNFKGKGIDGKLAAIVQKLPNFSWIKNASPYQELKDLEDFRNILAHGKVLASQYVVEGKENGLHFQFSHAWEKYISVSAVTAARSAISSFCQSLVVELRKVSDHPHLNFDAFQGALAQGTSAPVDSHVRST